MRTLTTVIALMSLAAGAQAAHPNALWTKLLTEGVTVREGLNIPFPPPTMPDGLDAAAQREALLSITDRNHPVERLLRESVVAPFVLRIETERASPEGPPVRSIDLWFVTYGKLDLLADESFLRDAVSVAPKGGDRGLPTRSDFLSDDALISRGLKSAEREGIREGWFRAEFELLDRVYVGVTRHSMASRTDESVLVAARLDPRFFHDAEFPNRWQSITRDELGKIVLGPAHPYSGAGFYIKVTRLHEPPGALFVEYHQVFDEPQGWFKGKNLLRSKLPLIVQDGVRKFRRKLAAADTPSS